MRVIGGIWKGRRLTAPPGQVIRPTTDRVKEALFNILGPALAGTVFVDLCCGAGGLGIEALSRGAARVVFVDAHQGALSAVRKNLAACDAAAAPAEFVRADALAWLGRWEPPAAGAAWIAVADPPYAGELAQGIMAQLESLAHRPGFIAGIVEHGRATPAVRDRQDGGPWEHRRYGESILAILRSGPATNPGKE
jgi:16S rRNA (guanine966-N2)-methyltransferase